MYQFILYTVLLSVSLTLSGMKRPSKEKSEQPCKKACNTAHALLPEEQCILEAVQSGNITVFDDLDSQQPSYVILSKALTLALENGKVAIVEKLANYAQRHKLTLNINQDFKRNSFRSLLRKVVRHGNVTLLNKAFELGAALHSSCSPYHYLNEALDEAAEYGHKQVVQRLIELGARFNNLNRQLIAATYKGYREFVLFLIAQGASVNAQCYDLRTALIIAVQKGYVDIVRDLLKHGATVSSQDANNNTALIKAAEIRHTEIVSLLIKAGAQVNHINKEGSTALIATITGPTFLDNSPNTYTKDCFPTVQALIAADADVHKRNKYGNTALSLAYGSSSAQVVAKLIGAGAHFPPDRTLYPADDESYYLLRTYANKASYSYLADPLGYTQRFIDHSIKQALYIRQCAVNKNQCQLELVSFADADHKSCLHQTPLMWAAIFGHTQVIELLLKQNLPHWYINAQDSHGRTALMLAIIFGNFNCARLLLPYSTKGINLKDSNNKSALLYAIEKQDVRLIYELIGAGATDKAKALKHAAEHSPDHRITASLLLSCLQYPHLFK